MGRESRRQYYRNIEYHIMFGRDLSGVRPSNFKMDQTREQRKFMYDLVYKWTPLGLVVYLFIVCTAMLSVSGNLSHAEVIGFCVTAGLLIAFFASCHLVLYCTRIKDQMDLEKNQGHSTTNSSSRSEPSAGVHGQSAQQDHDNNGQQVNQSGPNNPGVGLPQNHPAAALPNANLQAQVEDVLDEEPVRPPLRVTNGVPQSTLSINHRNHHGQRIRSHGSAAPEPLSMRSQQAGRSGIGGGQRRYVPYRPLDPRTPSYQTRARDSRNTVEEVSSLHAAGLTPEEAMDSVRRTMETEPWSTSRGQRPSQQRRHGQPAVGNQGSSYTLGNAPPGQRVGRQLFLGSPSSPDNLVPLPNQRNEVANQAGPQSHPVELSAGEVQGYFVLLQEPDLMDLLSRRLLEWKPRPCALNWSGHGVLEKQVTRRADDTGVVVVDNPERKSVSIHKAPGTVERMPSQRAEIQYQHSPVRPWRRSADSGYCSVDKMRHSVSTMQLHTGGRNSVVSSVSSGDWCSFVSLEKRSSLHSEHEVEDGMFVPREVIEQPMSRRRASTLS